MCSAMRRRRWSNGTTWSPSFGVYFGGLYARSVMAMGPNPWYPGPKLGGGGCEYTGAIGGWEYGCAYGGGGAVGAFWPGNVLKGGCSSDCWEEVAPFSRYVVTSDFITRPPAPDPGTLLRSNPCSCATLRPTGVARTPFASASGSAAAGAEGAAGAAALGAGFALGAAAAAAAPASSRRASRPPTLTTA